MSINIRNRPGLFVGSTSIAGVYTLIFELVEDIMQNSGKKDVLIKMELIGKDTCVLECEAFGAEYWLDDSEIYNNALWLKVVKALSDTCKLQIGNEAYTYEKGALVSQEYIAADIGPDKVKLTFRPDREIFSYQEIDYYMLFRRMKELAQLNKHLTLHLADEINKNLFHFNCGLEVMLLENAELTYLYNKEPLNIHFIEDDVEVSVSMAYGYASDVKLSYVNNIRTYDGGAHVQGLHDGIFAAFEKYMKSHMDENMVIMKKNVTKTLNFVLHVKMSHPQFDGAVKRGLGDTRLKPIVRNGVMKHLYAILESDQSFLNASYSGMIHTEI